MSDRDAATPRVFLVRHGETDWAKSGRYTGTTEIELTPNGIEKISSMATTLVGTDKLIDPSRLAHIYVSPRNRTRQTFELLFDTIGAWKNAITYTEDIAEWNYGDYEGLKESEIRSLRRKKGLDTEREWNIWRDGCEGGESMHQISERLDSLIHRIREIQKPDMRGEQPANVLVVAHGLILRCFAKRWLGCTVDFDLDMILAPGAVAILSYKNSDVDRPAIHLGLQL